MERHGRRAALTAALCALGLALGAAPAFGATGFEAGDTGELPAGAQDVGPAAGLDMIKGHIGGVGDRDVYKVCLTGEGTFSASTVRATGWDTQLFLLDSGGKAVYSNDDTDGRQSVLPANHDLTPGPGQYYLAIAAFNAEPAGTDSSGMKVPLFQSSSRGVNGPSQEQDLRLSMAGWTGNTTSSGGHYEIDLTGARGCDRTAPTIGIDAPADGAEFELGEQVPADYTCEDPSGVASCTGDVANGTPIDTSSLGEKTFTVVALDNKGNMGEKSVTYTVVDKTDPTVDLRSPQDGAEYVRGQRVEADYSCGDAGGSGLASCEGDVADGAPIDTASLGQKSFSVTARDGSGNKTVVTRSYRVVDKTKPTVRLRSPLDGAEYERNASVEVDYSCEDDPGGSGMVGGLAQCSGDRADGQALDTSTLGKHSFSVTATDAAGNSATVTHSYTVVDGRAPEIVVRTPANGTSYSLDQDVTADYSCTEEDGGSGLASCTGTVANGAAVETSDFGPHSFKVTATDRAGNTATKTVTYNVVFAFEGFYGLDDPLNRENAGSTVKIAFSLDGYHGREVFATGYPRSVKIDCRSGAPIGREARAQSPGRTKLRYKPRRDLYIYLWKTDKDWRGECRQFVLKLDDGSVHRINFRFSSKRH